MRQQERGVAGNFVGDTLASLRIGIWSWRGSPDRVQCCPVAARMFGVPSEEAWTGLPLERFASGVHPDDRDRFAYLIEQASRTGGPFVAEYRIVTADDTTRSVLDRGEFEMGPDGRAIAACGVIVDQTDCSRGADIGGSPYDPSNFADLPPLDQAVEHALALYRLLDVVPAPRRQLAEMLLGSVLEILGKEVAAGLQRAGFRLPHQGRDVH